MKKLMLLAAMLAMVMAAAIPALAQNIEPASGLERTDEDELICLLPEGCDTGASVEPAFGGVEPAPGYGYVEPAPGNVDSGDCSDVLEDPVIRRASEPSLVSDGTSVVPAEEPGCFAIPVPATAGGSSESYSW